MDRSIGPHNSHGHYHRIRTLFQAKAISSTRPNQRSMGPDLVAIPCSTIETQWPIRIIIIRPSMGITTIVQQRTVVGRNAVEKQ